jgi:hypothetical protein
MVLVSVASRLIGYALGSVEFSDEASAESIVAKLGEFFKADELEVEQNAHILTSLLSEHALIVVILSS